jgi:hypothetical protein
MAKANPGRGEHELVLAGKTYMLRPSHVALSAIERATGRATIELVRAGNVGGLRLSELGIIGGELIRAGAGEQDGMTRSVSDERISELILEEGLAPATSVLTLCLLDAASGGRTASGEAKAAPAAPTTKTAGAA